MLRNLLGLETEKGFIVLSHGWNPIRRRTSICIHNVWEAWNVERSDDVDSASSVSVCGRLLLRHRVVAIADRDREVAEDVLVLAARLVAHAFQLVVRPVQCLTVTWLSTR